MAIDKSNPTITKLEIRPRLIGKPKVIKDDASELFSYENEVRNENPIITVSKETHYHFDKKQISKEKRKKIETYTHFRCHEKYCMEDALNSGIEIEPPYFVNHRSDGFSAVI